MWGKTFRGVSAPSTQHKTVLAVSAVRAKALDLKFQALNSPPVTPAKADCLKFLLQGYDPTSKRFLVDGFRYGFRIHFVGERSAYDSPNLKSALDKRDITSEKLRKECEAGRIVGPFPAPPFRNFRTSPLGFVPKKDPTEFRLIHYLSFPTGSSVNDFIPDSCSTVKYASVRDASKSIKQLGAWLSYGKNRRQICLSYNSFSPCRLFLSGHEMGQLVFLGMGLRSSCNTFEALSTCLEWLAVHLLGASSVLHILDDLLFITPTKDKCERDLANFILMCTYLGVSLAPEKTTGPATVLQFAGITLDSVHMEARLPEAKLQKCRNLLTDSPARRSVRLRELQSLIGLLNFTCFVVVPGRAFLRRLIDLKKGVR